MSIPSDFSNYFRDISKKRNEEEAPKPTIPEAQESKQLPDVVLQEEADMEQEIAYLVNHWNVAFPGIENKGEEIKNQLQAHWHALQTCPLRIYLNPKTKELGFFGPQLGKASDHYLMNGVLHLRCYCSFKVADEAKLKDIPEVWNLFDEQQYRDPERAIAAIVSFFKATPHTLKDPKASPSHFGQGQFGYLDWFKTAVSQTKELSLDQIQKGIDRLELFRLLSSFEASDFSKHDLKPVYHLALKLKGNQGLTEEEEGLVRAKLREFEERLKVKSLSARQQIDALSTISLTTIRRETPKEGASERATAQISSTSPEDRKVNGSAKDVQAQALSDRQKEELQQIDEVRRLFASPETLSQGLDLLSSFKHTLAVYGGDFKYFNQLPPLGDPIWATVLRSEELRKQALESARRLALDYCSPNGGKAGPVIGALISYPIALFSHFVDVQNPSDEEITAFRIAHFTPFIVRISYECDFTDPMVAKRAEEIARQFFNDLGLNPSRSLIDCLEDPKVRQLVEQWNPEKNGHNVVGEREFADWKKEVEKFRDKNSAFVDELTKVLFREQRIAHIIRKIQDALGEKGGVDPAVKRKFWDECTNAWNERQDQVLKELKEKMLKFMELRDKEPKSPLLYPLKKEIFILMQNSDQKKKLKDWGSMHTDKIKEFRRPRLTGNIFYTCNEGMLESMQDKLKALKIDIHVSTEIKEPTNEMKRLICTFGISPEEYREIGENQFADLLTRQLLLRTFCFKTEKTLRQILQNKQIPSNLIGKLLNEHSWMETFIVKSGLPPPRTTPNKILNDSPYNYAQKEIFSQRYDEIVKALSLLKQSSNNKDARDTLKRALFDFGQIEALIHYEKCSTSVPLLTKIIPEIFAEITNELLEIVRNSNYNIMKGGWSALVEIKLIAEELVNFLKIYAPEQDRSALEQFLESAAAALQIETLAKEKAVSSSMIEAYLLELNPLRDSGYAERELKLFCYLDDVDFLKYMDHKQFQEIITSWLEGHLPHEMVENVTVTFSDEKAGFYLQYLDREPQVIKSLANVLELLGLKESRFEPLKNRLFIQEFRALTGLNLTSYPLEKDPNGSWRVKGTDFVITPEGAVHYRGGLCIQAPLELELPFKLQRQDICCQFQDQLQIYRNGKILVIVKEGFVYKPEENLICERREVSGIEGWAWYRNRGQEQWKPTSFTTTKPFHQEYRLIKSSQDAETFRLESKEYPGYFLTKAPFHFQGEDLAMKMKDAVVLQKNSQEAILLCPCFDEVIALEMSGDHVSCEDPWGLLAFLLEAGCYDLVEVWKDQLQFTKPSTLFQEKVAAKLIKSIMEFPSSDPVSFGQKMYLCALDAAISGYNAAMIEFDDQKMIGLVNEYMGYVGAIQEGRASPVSQEIERRFLVQLKQFFDAGDVEKKAPGMVKYQLQMKGKGSNLLKKIFGRPIPFDVLQRRLIYRTMVEPFISSRLEELKRGVPVKVKKPFKITIPNWEFDFKFDIEDVDRSQTRNFVKDLLQLKRPLKDFDQQFVLNDQLIKNELPFYYKIAREGTASQRERLLTILKLCEDPRSYVKWLKKVCEHPNKYPSVAECKRMNEAVEKRREQLQAKLEKEKKSASFNAYIEMKIERKLKPEKLYAPLTRKLFGSKPSKLAFLWNAYKMGIAANQKMSKMWRHVKKPFAFQDLSFGRLFETFKREMESEANVQVILGACDTKFDAFLTEIGAPFVRVKDETHPEVLPKYNAEIGEYLEVNPAYTYEVVSKEVVKATLDRIANEVVSLEDQLQGYQKELLERANHVQDETREWMRRERGVELSWNDLVKLMYNREEHALHKKLGSPEDALELEAHFLSYLAARARYMQLGRITEALRKLEQSPEDQTLLQEAHLQIHARRAYDGKNPQDRLLLFFDAASPKGLYRKDQYEKIKELDEDARTLGQMPTGSGKTDYVLAVLNKMKKGEMPPVIKKGEGPKVLLQKGVRQIKRLVLNIWPAAIAGLNKAAIAQKMRQAIGEEVFEIRFSRSMALDSAQLDLLALSLKRAVKKGTAISMRAEDVSSLILHFIEALESELENVKNGQKPQMENLRRIEKYKDILRILNGPAFGTIDESHAVLDPMQRTIYTVGNSENCPTLAINFSVDFYKILLESPEFSAILRANETLTEELLNRTLKAIFSEEFMTKWAKLLHVNEGEESKLLPFLEGTGEMPAHHGDEKLFYLSKGYYKTILESAVAGSVGRDFGLSKMFQKDFKYAIPYDKKDVPKEREGAYGPSSYQNIDETLCKTLRTYCFTGLNKNQLAELIAQSFMRQRSVNEGVKNEARIAIENYCQAIPELRTHLKALNGVLDQKSLHTMLTACLPDDFDKYAFAGEYVKHVVAPTLFYYPTSIGMTPQDLLLMFDRSASVSATPQPTEAHSLKTEFKKMKGAQGKMYHLMSSKMCAIKHIPDNEEELLRAISTACIRKDKPVRALCDPSGTREFTLAFVQSLAMRLKEDKAELEYILYYDLEEDRFMRYSIKDGQKMPYQEKSHLHSMDKTVTLYDQARSTGTDIKQAPNASMILLTGKASTANEVGQGIGRMRQLDKGQSYEIWTKDHSVEVTLNPTLAQKSALIELFDQNQKAADRPRNKIAVQQLMAAELRNAALRKLLDLPISRDSKKMLREKSIEDTLKLYSKLRGEFVTQMEYDPKSMYGHMGTKTSVKEGLDALQKRKIKQAKELLGSDAKPVINSLKEYSAIWKEDLLAMDEMEYSVQSGTSQEVSAQQEQEVEVEVEMNEAPTPKHNWTKKIHVWPDRLSGVKFVASGSKPKSTGKNVKFFRFGQGLKALQGGQYAILSPLFSNDLLATNNAFDSIGALNKAYVRSENRKRLDHVLLIEEKDKDKSCFKAVLVDPMDERAIHGLIEKSRLENDGNDPKIALYNLDLNRVIDRNERAFNDEIFHDVNLKRLILQAKLANGNLNITIEESTLLLEMLGHDDQQADRLVALMMQLHPNSKRTANYYKMKLGIG